MGSNYLKGTDGDKMSAFLATCGFNLRKLLRAFLWLVFQRTRPIQIVADPLCQDPPVSLKRLGIESPGIGYGHPGLNMGFPSAIA